MADAELRAELAVTGVQACSDVAALGPGTRSSSR
jgi:hypothetical protein